MRIPRLLLACLLGLGVCLQGAASVRAMEAGCPMARAAEPAPAPIHGMGMPMTGMDHAGHQMSGMADQGHAGHGDADQGNGPGGSGTDCAGTSHCTCATGCHPASPAPGLAAAAPAFQLADTRVAPLAIGFRSFTSPWHWRPPAHA